MFINKNRSRNLLFLVLKTLCLITGLNIFLTSLFMIMRGELNKDKQEFVINTKIINLNNDQNIQFSEDIY